MPSIGQYIERQKHNNHCIISDELSVDVNIDLVYNKVNAFNNYLFID
jgi:hypothetical protein